MTAIDVRLSVARSVTNRTTKEFHRSGKIFVQIQPKYKA